MISKAATFRALDQLPEPVRHEIQFAARVWEAPDVLTQYRPAAQARGADWANGWMTASIRAGDEQAVREFGIAYRLRYGHDLPHLGADATILRYQPPVGVRKYKMIGGSVRVRAAWRSSETLLPGGA